VQPAHCRDGNKAFGAYNYHARDGACGAAEFQFGSAVSCDQVILRYFERCAWPRAKRQHTIFHDPVKGIVGLHLVAQHFVVVVHSLVVTVEISVEFSVDFCADIAPPSRR
jgi:hypothetical protein